MKTKLFQFTGLFLLMLVAGVFWGTWFTLTRTIADFSPAEFIHIGQVIIANVAAPMRVIMPSCILFMILSVWYYPQKKTAGHYFGLMALGLIVVTLLITLLVLVPIDYQIKDWTVLTIPADWEAVRGRWQFNHALRTFTSLAGFGCFAISVLSHNNIPTGKI
jgi:hypothetical protein